MFSFPSSGSGEGVFEAFLGMLASLTEIENMKWYCNVKVSFTYH